MKLFKTLISLILIVLILTLGIWFSLRNSEPVGLDLIFIQFAEKGLGLWLLLTLAAGVLLGWLLSLPKQIKNLAVIKLNQRKLEQLKKEVHQLRNQSFTNLDSEAK